MKKREKTLLNAFKKVVKKGNGSFDMFVNMLFQNMNTEKHQFDGKMVCNADKTVLVCYVADLERIAVPGTVKTIGTMALRNHKKLQRLTLPQGLETIGKKAVSQCDALQSVRIPASVKTIKKGAFSKNGNLQKVAFEGVPERLSRHCFDDCPLLQQIEVPAGSDEFFRQTLQIDENSELQLTETAVVGEKK
jgi:hypothetical protein